MNFFEKSNNKENKKEAFAKISSSSPEGVLLIENLPGNQTLEVSLDELRAGGLEKIAQLLRPEDLAAIMLMLRAADQQVLLAQVDGAIPVQVSNLEPLAKITESSGDVSVKRAGQVLTLKVGDSVLAGDEVMAMAKSVSLQVIGRSGEAGPVVKLSGVVQFSMTATAPDAPSKVLIAVSEGPVAVLGSALAQQSVVVSTPAGSVASSGGGAGYGVSVSDSGVTTLVSTSGRQEVSFVGATGARQSLTATVEGIQLNAAQPTSGTPLSTPSAAVSQAAVKAVFDLVGQAGAGSAIGSSDSTQSASGTSVSSATSLKAPSASAPSFSLTAAPFSGQNAAAEAASNTSATSSIATPNSAVSVAAPSALDMSSKSSPAPTPKVSLAQSMSTQFDEQSGRVTGRVELSFVSVMPATVVVTLVGNDPRFPSNRTATVTVAAGQQFQDFAFDLQVQAQNIAVAGLPADA